ncbi:efflux transporter outer membrane subunit [Ramlibacter sp. USB13]|uniref:Efflux transporter outer membrane subunit n=1 Tax=Ramlibacter cellulosilyticus TaxID=2764187 RepID=A0A923MPR4_9BURK|nr:efflux transporter outer membrane subunit [Ramlibacter cellulosilyticus]MBC5782309.1 efflux transporter outer membrane subunit [Ramlibacter cellulosilyticus]
MKKIALLPLVGALLLAGCATTLPELPAEPPPPAQFKQDIRWTTAAPAEAQHRGEWWKAFADPQLETLVQRAAVANTSVREAAARVAQARALVRAANAERLPQVGIGAGVDRGTGTDSAGRSGPFTVYNAGVQLAYEPDLFGRATGRRDAASLDASAREALLQSTRLAVQAETAQTYLALRALDVERALVRETVEAYSGTLRLTQRRHQAGDVAELDVVRVEAEVAATEAEALAIDRQRAALEHALAVLIGEAASDFNLPVAQWTTALPTIPAGVPATVLARRPDVAAAQASLLAAQARVGVAEAAWFPGIALTGAGGFASADLGDLFRWSARAWGVGALLSLPIFDGGRRKAGIEDAKAQLEEALASHRGQVLVAFREVEDQLAALHLLHQQSLAQGRAVDAALRATRLSDTRYRNGLVSQLELLDARRSELRNRRQALQVRAAQFQATVSLVRALGGGWGEPPTQVAAGGP